ncbi:MAG: hypothetical protein MJE77_07515 [Proteobacteria bacterium]|nr:hypothetical protein [Pseudomonadota bacterium]
MFIGALLIGLLTAYYFGLKPGIIAAAASVLLFIVADAVPPAQLAIYAVIAVFITGVCFLGPRTARSDETDPQNAVRRWTRRLVGELWRRL